MNESIGDIIACMELNDDVFLSQQDFGKCHASSSKFTQNLQSYRTLLNDLCAFVPCGLNNGTIMHKCLNGNH